MRICPGCNAHTEDFICPVCSTKTITEDEYVRLHADPDGLVGKELMDRYTVIRLVGIGGMGNVYEARHKLFDKRFAVKVIKNILVDNQEAVKRFQREALLASKLDHPNIVKVYDFGETQSGQQFILMEFVDGENLRSLMKHEKHLSPFRSAGLFLQLSKAIEYAHNKKLVHRDLKPDNIFVRHINGEDFIKVVDFGVAKLLQDDTSRTLTKDGYTPGTPEYMSPEQVLAKHDVDGRSDLYSLGLIVYEMLTGIRPFRRETPLASAVAHLRESIPPFSKELRARLPRGLEPLILQLVSRKPSKRPQSASEVIARLKQLRFDSTSVTGGTPGDDGALRTPRSTKSLTPFTTSDLTKRLSQNLTSNETRVDFNVNDRKGLWMMLGIIGIGVLIAGGIVFFYSGNSKNSGKNVPGIAQLHTAQHSHVEVRTADIKPLALHRRNVLQNIRIQDVKKTISLKKRTKKRKYSTKKRNIVKNKHTNEPFIPKW